jgi:CubicO group peptidase (beta-lactamase class C family)
MVAHARRIQQCARAVTVGLGAVALLACASVVPPPAAPAALPFEPGIAGANRKEKLIALAPQLDAFFRERLDRYGATGLAVGIVIDGELVYGRGFGVTDRESPQPIGLDSVFRIASMSKSFTALSVLKLRDEGKLSLDAPISTYLPELRSLAPPTRDSPPITARLLLTHASGLTWDDLWGGVSFGFTEAELGPLLRAGVPFTHAPGGTFEYSNLGYALLGRVVERVSGAPFRDYVTANILHPLGMHSTYASAEQVPPGELAAAYWGPDLTRAPTPPSTVFAPAGGLYTSLRDYARYIAYQLSAYPPRDEPERGPVRRSTLREAHVGQRFVRDPREPIARRTASGVALRTSGAGFGWFNLTTCQDEGRLEHFGWEPGYFAAVTILPRHQFGLVTMATTQSVRALEDVLALIRDAGALPPESELTPSLALRQAQRGVNQLLTRWEKAVVEMTFDPRDVHYPWFGQLEKDFGEMAREHGRCEPEGALRARVASQGSWRMRCERGAIDFIVDLSPTTPARVQWLRYERELPPDERLNQAARSVVAALGGTREPLSNLLAAGVDGAQIHNQLAHAAIDHGNCRIEHGVSTGGGARGVFVLTCDRGKLELALDLQPQTRQIAALNLGMPHAPGDPCWH